MNNEFCRTCGYCQANTRDGATDCYVGQRNAVKNSDTGEIVRCGDYNFNKYWKFLEKLRRSGETNTYGAAPYLMEEFGCGYATACTELVRWMTEYNVDDYGDAKTAAAHGYVILRQRYPDSNSDEELERFVAVNSAWLEGYIARELSEYNSLDAFMADYNSEDVTSLMDEVPFGENNIYFTVSPSEDYPLGCGQADEWKLHAMADIISDILQDDGEDSASKSIDCLFSL